MNSNVSPAINQKENNIFNGEFEESEENYIKINSKSNFEISNSEESKNKLSEILKYDEELMDEQFPTDKISEIFFKRLFPKSEQKAILISKYISKKIMKTKQVTNGLIEHILQHFLKERTSLAYTKKLLLDKETIKNIGYILCYLYSKFDDYKINSLKDLKKNLGADSSKNLAQNIVNEFLKFCGEKGKFPTDCSIMKFLKYLEKDYICLLPSEFIFLMNIFDVIDFLEINMDITLDSSNENKKQDFYLFIITQLNIHFLTNMTKEI
jgi:hypothetical protein